MNNKEEKKNINESKNNKDIVSNSISKTNWLISNPLFKKLICLIFIIFALNKYAGIKSKDIEKTKNKTFKKVVNTFSTVTLIRKDPYNVSMKEKERRRRVIENERKEKAQDEKIINNLKEEFKIQKNKQGKKITSKNRVKIKFIIENDNEYLAQNPTELIVNMNEKNDIFASQLKNKNVGDVFRIPFSNIMNQKQMIEGFKEIEKEDKNTTIQNVKNATLNMNYIIKIISIEK